MLFRSGLENISVSSKKLNIVANQNLPLPKIVKIPVLNMKLHYNNQEKIARVLLDSGSSIPILSDKWAIRNQTPVAERETKRPIRDYAGNEVPGSGSFFTSPLPLQYKTHWSTISFEVGPMAPEYDIILPNWWLNEQIGRAHV